MMQQASRVDLPQFKPIYYDPETQTFLYTYENGGMMVQGNHLSTSHVNLHDVVFGLVQRVEHLERELAKSQPPVQSKSQLKNEDNSHAKS